MKVFAKTGNEEIATVYLAEISHGKIVEFVESLQPPLPREDKWVLIVSTLFGCPVGCRFCDSGNFYKGKLERDDILCQIDYMVKRRFPDGVVPVKKFKIQFSRMGEPAFNMAVIDVLEQLPHRYNAENILPVVSTIAPKGTSKFFERLFEVKNGLYETNFQLQFSIHSTDRKLRDWLMPVKKWGLDRIASYGEKFYNRGGRKITLNFALSTDTIIDQDEMLKYFDPEKFLIKITPVNPTYQSIMNNITSSITPEQTESEIIALLKAAGYDVILSIGEWEENQIGSNCGQLITRYLKEKEKIKDSYTFSVVDVPTDG